MKASELAIGDIFLYSNMEYLVIPQVITEYGIIVNSVRRDGKMLLIKQEENVKLLARYANSFFNETQRI